MKSLMQSWVLWALLSAGFAALTAIFAKIGIENVNSDFATFVRTVVILLAAGLIVYVTDNWQPPSSVSPKTWLFLVLSGAATGASWICYFRALKLGDAGRLPRLGLRHCFGSKTEERLGPIVAQRIRTKRAR